MAIHFKKNESAELLKGGNLEEGLLKQIQQTLTRSDSSNLGFFRNRKLKNRVGDIRLEEETRKAELQSEEALATFKHAQTTLAAAERLALSRLIGGAVVAEVEAMGECYAAAVHAQTDARKAASWANLLARNADVGTIQKALQNGDISQDDAVAMVMAAQDRHISAEERLEKMANAVAETTDRVYQNGLLPAHRINQM